jgi:hypothetical protein
VSIAELYDRGGQGGLMALPGIGKKIAGLVADWLEEK